MASKSKTPGKLKVDRFAQLEGLIRELQGAVIGLEATVEILDKQVAIQKRVRGAARQLALAERQLQRVLNDTDLVGLVGTARRHWDTSNRVFCAFLAELPEWSYEAEFNERRDELAPARPPEREREFAR